MTEDIRKIFKSLASKRADPNLKGITGSIRFDITKVGHWRVTISDGKISVSQSSAKTDCAISLSEEDALKIYAGRLSLLIAIMQGRAKLKGDLILAQKLYGSMRVRAKTRTTQKGNKWVKIP